MRRTQELAFLNTPIAVETALDMGLITRVVDDDALESESENIARFLSKGPTVAFGHTRALLLSSLVNSFETQLELESHAIASSAASPDGREGVNAFLEKRTPNFMGVLGDAPSESV